MRSLTVFLVLTFSVSAIFYARSYSGAPLGQVAPFLMWTPGLAAIVTQFIFYRTLGGLGWHPGPWRYLVWGFVLPFVYCLAIYVPVWALGLGRFDGAYVAGRLSLLPLFMVLSVFTALGEEIGWRGFLVPAFYRSRGFAWAGVGTGIIWALWHVPLIAFGGYDAGTPLWYGVACFLIWVPAMSVMMAWLRLRSGSLWPAAICHGTHNLVIQGIFDRSTIDTGPTKWITTEFGFGITIVAIVIAAYFWRRRDELPQG